ncbi:hypothetical protein L1080_023345 [Rhodococcus sp. MSC1_016]|jgi:hypothetical protein|uniref:hypothetical protein n=1 Tax=Rhodococcus sp. MSC1_016 TaxID=2909266 RepID=UPI00202FBFE8|nr:hypothetical protein [Rhodococcus sp. MSC1_016]
MTDNIRHLHAVTATVAATPTDVQVWRELPDDPEHPTYEGAPRLLIERHDHQLHHDRADEWQSAPLTAVYVDDGLSGARIEFGPWSLEASEARLLAVSLNTLADACDPSGNRRAK